MRSFFTILTLLVLAASTFCTVSGSAMAPAINKWQATILGDNQYFPALTILIMALPALLLILAIQQLLKRSAQRNK